MQLFMSQVKMMKKTLRISSLNVCNDLKDFVTNVLETHHYVGHTNGGVSIYDTLGSCFSENCIYLIGAHSIDCAMYAFYGMRANL